MIMDDSVTLPSLTAATAAVPTATSTDQGAPGALDTGDDLSVDSHGSFVDPAAATAQQPQPQPQRPPAPSAAASVASGRSSARNSIASRGPGVEMALVPQDDAPDDDSVAASSVTSFTRRRNEKRAKELKGTILLFHWANGERQEKELPYRPVTYSEVQREIAKFFPKRLSLFVLQAPESREKLFPHNFKPLDLIVVREVLYPAPEGRPPQLRLSTRWEGEDYHDARYRREFEAEQATNDIWGQRAGIAGLAGGATAAPSFNATGNSTWSVPGGANHRTAPF